MEHRDRVVEVGEPVHPGSPAGCAPGQGLQAVAGALRLGPERAVGLAPGGDMRKIAPRGDSASAVGRGGLGCHAAAASLAASLGGRRDAVDGQQQGAVVGSQNRHGRRRPQRCPEPRRGAGIRHGGPRRRRARTDAGFEDGQRRTARLPAGVGVGVRRRRQGRPTASPRSRITDWSPTSTRDQPCWTWTSSLVPAACASLRVLVAREPASSPRARGHPGGAVPATSTPRPPASLVHSAAPSPRRVDLHRGGAGGSTKRRQPDARARR